MDYDSKHSADVADAIETTYVEVPCQRAVGGDEFGRGVQDYSWGVSNPSCWFPSKSYFRVELEVYGPGGLAAANAPTMSDQIALAENCVNNAFTNAYMHMGGQVVSSLVNFMPQCGAIASRVCHSGAWMKTVGSAYGLSGTLSERIASISTTGTGEGVVGIDNLPEEMYRPVNASSAATLAVTATTAGFDTVLTSGAAALSTAFRNGTADAGVRIILRGVTFVILSVATAGGIQTITTRGSSPNVAATTSWYAVRRQVARAQQARNKIQVIYQPPLGIFKYQLPMGAGQYKLSLSPDPNFRLTMLESLIPDFDATGVNSRLDVRITNIRYYAAIAKLAILDATVNLDLAEFSAQSKTMTAKSGQYSFSVPQSTEILYIALQSPSAGSSPRFPPNKFTAVNDSDTNLELIQVTYGSQTKPQTRWDSSFEAGKNNLRQFYQNTLCETMNLDREGGAESFDEWLQRGPLYAFRFDRAENARDTEVTVQISYRDPAAGVLFDNNSKLFVIAEYRKLTKVTHSAGSITSVISLNA